MDKNRTDDRRFPRMPFSTDKGLVGLVVRPESDDEIAIARVMDISKAGFRIALKRKRRQAFAVGERLNMTAFKGTANVEFSEPIQLEIVWAKSPPDADHVEIGCKLVYASNAVREQMAGFVEEEMIWNGKVYQMKPKEGVNAMTPPSGSHQAKAERTITGVGRVEPQYRKYLAIGGGVLAFLLAALFFLYLANAGRSPDKRLDSLEARLNQLQEQMTTSENTEKQLRSVGKQVASLSKNADKTREDIAQIEQRLDSLARRTETSEAQRSPKAPAAAPSAPVKKESGSPAAGLYHEVQKGENLYRISLKYKTTVEKLCEINNIRPDQTLYVGYKLQVPGP